MRITINHTETSYRGFFKSEPRYRVDCKIEFSQEEIAIIQKRKLGEIQVYTQNFDPKYPCEVMLKEVVKSGIWDVFTTPLDARNFEHELTTELLPKLKNYIAANADIKQTATSFEL